MTVLPLRSKIFALGGKAFRSFAALDVDALVLGGCSAGAVDHSRVHEHNDGGILTHIGLERRRSLRGRKSGRQQARRRNGHAQNTQN
jgi:hypothetical protein